MYIFIREETNPIGETVVIVQEPSLVDAKKLAGVSPNHTRWVSVIDDRVMELAKAEHKVIERRL